MNNLKFISEEEDEIKKRSLPKKPRPEKDKKLDKEKEKEREAKKKAYLERKALIIEQNKIKADEDRMYHLLSNLSIIFYEKIETNTRGRVQRS